MSWSMQGHGNSKFVIKEIYVKIDENWNVSGEADFICIGKVILKGILEHFYQIPVQELDQRINRPIILHAKFTNMAREDEEIYANDAKTPRNFLKGFSKVQTIRFCQLGRNDEMVTIEFSSEENGEWQCTTGLNNIKILEEKNMKRA